MAITPTQMKTINNYSFPRQFVRGMASRGFLPVILLECFVTGGRTYHAHKRDGFIEARERFTEEAIGAAFWFGGVKAFNAINDKIGQKALKFDDKKLYGSGVMDFDCGKDSMRNPVSNFLQWINNARAEARKMATDAGTKVNPKIVGEVTLKKLAEFKFAKIAASIILANILVGLVVPKLNQKITENYQQKRTEKEQPNQSNTKLTQDNATKDANNIPNKFKALSVEDFISGAQEKKRTMQDVAFGNGATQTLLSLAHMFENKAVYQLLSTDVGVAGGRAISARNKHERTEVLFRDLSAIYFYLFSMPMINGLLNKITDGRKTRLDPVLTQLVHERMDEILKDSAGEKLSPEKFASKMLGDDNKKYKISEQFAENFKKGPVHLDDFLDFIKNNPELSNADKAKYSDIAKRMSELQPKHTTVKALADGTTQYISKSILSESQVKNVFKEGLLNDPDLLKDAYNIITGGKPAKIDKATGKIIKEAVPGKFMQDFKYVDSADINAVKRDMSNYIKDICTKAAKKGTDITRKTLKNANYENFTKNALHWGAGFAISALFLSDILPKIQYWITKQTTGKDTFPGITDYSNEEKGKFIA